MTILTFLFFTGLVGLLTWLMTRKDDHGTSAGYFLGGRTLTGGFIAGSLMLTNLSTEQLVGLNGAAFSEGFAVMAWEVIATLALVLMALFFLPRFLRLGVATIPEYLEDRFDHHTRTITSIIFLVAYAFILLPIVLYTGATGLTTMLDVKGILGFESDGAALWFMVWMIGIIGSIYAIFGGLRTVAVSDTLNGFGLVVGGFLIVYLGLDAVAGDEGGFLTGWQTLRETSPERFNSIGGSSSSVPFSTLFTGVLLLNLFYWTTNQQIIQRTLGASSLKEGQKGVLLAGALKLLGPMILVIPGIIAFHLHMVGSIEIPVGADGNPAADKAYGTLVSNILPQWLTGFFAAVMTGAILSSFNSALNATATLFSLGVYKGMARHDADDAHVIKVGKIFGGIAAVFAMVVAPMLAGQESIFGYLQTMNALYFIPIFSVVLVGALTKRVPAIAAKTALIAGVVVMLAMYFVPALAEAKEAAIHNFHFLGLVFAGLVVLMLIIGKVKPLAEPWSHTPCDDVDMTPWRYAKPMAVVLVVVVLSIYIYFADISVLNDAPALAEPVDPVAVEAPVADPAPAAVVPAAE
ncbi:MAG: solute:sodium symporter family transporter [Planctomycetota bacterium]|jgi:SSS family solute:Na+ symporter